MKTNIKKLMALLAFAPLAAPAFGADAAVYSTKPWLTPEPRQTFTIARVHGPCAVFIRFQI